MSYLVVKQWYGSPVQDTSPYHICMASLYNSRYKVVNLKVAASNYHSSVCAFNQYFHSDSGVTVTASDRIRTINTLCFTVLLTLMVSPVSCSANTVQYTPYLR